MTDKKDQEDQAALPKQGAWLLRDLVRLEEKFSAAKGGKEEGKDRAAYEALNNIASIIKQYAGWAVRHQLGRGKECAGVVPLGPPRVRNLPVYQKARAEADQHKWEISGDALYSYELIWPKDAAAPLEQPNVLRFMLWNILHPMIDIFPPDM